MNISKREFLKGLILSSLAGGLATSGLPGITEALPAPAPRAVRTDTAATDGSTASTTRTIDAE